MSWKVTRVLQDDACAQRVPICCALWVSWCLDSAGSRLATGSGSEGNPPGKGGLCPTARDHGTMMMKIEELYCSRIVPLQNVITQELLKRARAQEVVVEILCIQLLKSIQPSPSDLSSRTP